MNIQNNNIIRFKHTSEVLLSTFFQAEWDLGSGVQKEIVPQSVLLLP